MSSNLEDLILRDTRANQPTAGIAGRLYYVTDEQVTERDNGVTWEDSSDGASYTDEQAQDAVGAMIADTDTVDLTYTDATPELKADVKKQMSITSDASGLKLDGDSATPGNNKVYGTDGSGTKGWKDDPTGTGGGRTLLATATPSGTGTVTFNSIAGTYKKLTVEYVARSTRASNDSDPLTLQLNNDTTAANYRFVMVRGFGNGTAASFGADNANYSDIPAATAPSNSAEMGVVQIVQYANTTFNKQVMIDTVQRRDASSVQEIALHAGVEWENTAAVTRLDFILTNGNFVAGSEFNLYGEN